MFPPLLNKGDKIAIISPASIIKPEYIDGAADFFRSQGFEPVIMPHAKGPADGSYASSDANRLTDLTDAFKDPEVRAILCARGGYGCNHLIGRIPPELFIDNPKWLLGFSDISALHAAIQTAVFRSADGQSVSSQESQCRILPSLHAPMAKHLSELPSDHYCTRALMDILTCGLPVSYEVPTHPLATPGKAEGTLVGGNLAVINGLADTPFDPLRVPGPKILFIEDISEQIYAVERMLIRLQLSGRLNEVTGIICGQFTEYRPDRNFPDMETMIARTFRAPYNLPRSESHPSGQSFQIPIALSFPAGHTDDNLPLPLGAHASLDVTKENTRIKFS